MSNQQGGDGRIGDAAVDAAWRKASTEEPSTQTDAVILAAAGAGTQSPVGRPSARGATPWWTRWQPLAAAAGVAGLAFLVVQRLPTEPGRQDAMQAPIEAPAAPAVTARPEVVSADDAHLSAEATAPQPAEERSRAGGFADRPPPQRGVEIIGKPPVAPAANVLATPASADEGPARQVAQPFPAEVLDQAEDAAANVARKSPALVASEQAAGIAAAKSEVAASEPGAWVRRITALHDAGELAAAEDELRAFRMAYPDADARLPSSLHAWALTVGPQADR